MINHEAYRIGKQYTGKVQEIPGKQHNEMIIEFHSVTDLAANQDEVPWCSSWVNWCVAIANIKRNPYQAFFMLRDNGLTPFQIARLFARAELTIGAVTVGTQMKDLEVFAKRYLQNTDRPIQPPTFSAAAKSWLKWGESVKDEKLMIGDILVFSRDGGGHVGFWEKTGFFTYEVLGGNQSNEINVSPYRKSRLLDVRRGVV